MLCNRFSYSIPLLYIKFINGALNNAPRTGTGDLLISVQAVEPVKIPPVPDNEDRFEMFVNEASSNPTAELDEIIDNMVFELYGLDQEEREYVINNYR